MREPDYIGKCTIQEEVKQFTSKLPTVYHNAERLCSSLPPLRLSRSRSSHQGGRSVRFAISSFLMWMYHELERCFCLCGGILQQLSGIAFLSCCTAKPVLM